MFFYEQAAVLWMALSVLILCRISCRRCMALLGVNTAIFLVYYKIFSSMGSFGQRAAMVPFDIGTADDILKSWTPLPLYTNGFVRGLDMPPLYFAAVVVACLLLTVTESGKKPDLRLVAAGAVLFVAPYLPFFFLPGGVALRSAAIPLLGLAVFADGAFPNVTALRRGAVLALAFVFIVVCASEVGDYRRNYYHDQQIIAHTAKHLNTDKPNAVVGAKPYAVVQNVPFADHIKSIASSDWALTGALRQFTGDFALPMVAVNPENPDAYHIISLFDF